jgi:hypothetical protein
VPNQLSRRPLRLSALALLALISISLVGCDEKTGQQDPGQQAQDAWIKEQQERVRQAEKDRQPTPVPTPVTPVGGACGLYGNGPCH